MNRMRDFFICYIPPALFETLFFVGFEDRCWRFSFVVVWLVWLVGWEVGK